METKHSLPLNNIDVEPQIPDDMLEDEGAIENKNTLDVHINIFTDDPS